MIYYKGLEARKRELLIRSFIRDSDMFSITTDHKGRLTRAQVKKIRNELKIYFQEKERKCRQSYQTDPKYRKRMKQILGIKGKKDFLRYLSVMRKQDVSVFKQISYDICEDEEIYEPLIHRAYLRNTVSRISGTSVGGLYNTLYYKIEGFDHVVGEAGYGYLWLGKEQFWDVAFYRNGERIAQIHTDEGVVYCYFTADRYRDFSGLGIALKRSPRCL